MTDRQSTSKGFVILSAAGIINKVLALVYIPIQTHIIGNYGNGIVNAGYTIYTFMFFLSNAGIPAAISKLVSEQLTLGNYKNAQKIFKVSGVILLSFGTLAFAVLALGAHFFSNEISMPDAYLMLIALSPTMLFTSAASAFRGYFQGRQNMVPTAISQILEQALNTVLTVVFAALLIKYGIPAAAAGTTIGTSIGALGAAVFLFFTYIKSRNGIYKESLIHSRDSYILSVKSILKKMSLFSMPAILSIVAIYSYTLIDLKLGIGRLLAGGMDQHSATVLYGIFSTQYQRLLNIPLALTAALPIALIPAISAASVSKDNEILNRKINESFKVVFNILLPSAMGLAVLAKPIITLIFVSQKYNQGSDLMMLGAWTIILSAIINIEAGILIGIERPYIAPINMAISIVVKLVLNYFLIAIPQINMKGAIIGTFIGLLLASVLNYIMIKRYVKIEINFKKLISKPLLSSLTMAAAAYGIYMLINYTLNKLAATGIIISYIVKNDVATILAIAAGALVYLILLLKLKAVSTADIKKLPFGGRINSVLNRMHLI